MLFERRNPMMRKVAIFAGAAFWCCIVDQPDSLPAADLQSSTQTAEKPPDSCPITKPPQSPFIPPAPYPSNGSSWIGSRKLWTDIPKGGTWQGLPHYTPEDARFRQKLFWWSKGYDWRSENPPLLTIMGERLDGPSAPMSTDPHANAGWTND